MFHRLSLSKILIKFILFHFNENLKFYDEKTFQKKNDIFLSMKKAGSYVPRLSQVLSYSWPHFTKKLIHWIFSSIKTTWATSPFRYVIITARENSIKRRYFSMINCCNTKEGQSHISKQFFLHHYKDCYLYLGLQFEFATPKYIRVGFSCE